MISSAEQSTKLTLTKRWRLIHTQNPEEHNQSRAICMVRSSEPYPVWHETNKNVESHKIFMIFSEPKARRFELPWLECLSQISGILNLNEVALKSLAIERPGTWKFKMRTLCIYDLQNQFGAVLREHLWSSMGGSSIKSNHTHKSNGKHGNNTRGVSPNDRQIWYRNQGHQSN